MTALVLRISVYVVILCPVRFAFAQTPPVHSGRAAMTTGPKTLARLESDLLDPERKVLTVDRLTSSGTRIIWTYAPGDRPRNY